MSSSLQARPRRIGISQRELPASQGREAHDALDVAYIDWLSALLPGALVLPIPNFAQPEMALAFARTLAIDALLLSGGGDFEAQPRRNAIERALLVEAATQGWPVLGICRGMQALHCWHGGGVHPLAGHVGKPHRLTRIADDFAQTVNSWHRFAIHAAAPGWRPLAIADDGSVEAIQHQHLPWLGLMWHPEREHGGGAICAPWLSAIFQERE